MILTCPACGTQYVVKDGAIPPQGRQVRCASCKHSWHEQPELILDDEPEESLAEAAMIEPRSGPEIEERAFEEAALAEDADNSEMLDAPGSDEMGQAQAHFAAPADVASADAGEIPADTADEIDLGADDDGLVDDEFSPFASRDDIVSSRRSPFTGILIVALAIAALAAAFWFLAPAEWKSRIGLADVGQTPLQLTITHRERQQLASGNELLAVTGRVINPTGESQTVPPIQAELRSKQGKLVYRWTIAPPAPSLGPGASATFNSAEYNVPTGGDDLTITLGAPKA